MPLVMKTYSQKTHSAMNENDKMYMIYQVYISQ